MESTATGRPRVCILWQGRVSCPLSAAWHSCLAAHWSKCHCYKQAPSLYFSARRDLMSQRLFFQNHFTDFCHMWYCRNIKHRDTDLLSCGIMGNWQISYIYLLTQSKFLIDRITPIFYVVFIYFIYFISSWINIYRRAMLSLLTTLVY